MLKKTDVEGRAFDHHKHTKNKTAKIKATWGFLIFRLDKPSFFRGFDEESESRYYSNSFLVPKFPRQ